MGNLGGDPAAMTGGAHEIHAAGSSLGDLASSVQSDLHASAGTVGAPCLASSARRLAALSEGMLADTGSEALTAAQLASAAAADLDAATGGA